MSETRPDNHTLKSAETLVAFIKLRTDGIVHITLKEDAHLDKDQVEDLFKKLREVCGCKKCCVLLTSEGSVLMTRDAREFARTLENDSPVLKIAVVSNNLLFSIMVEIYQRFYQSSLPTQIFTATGQAENWLLEKPVHNTLE